VRQQLRGHLRIGHPDAHVHLQSAKAEIEQRGAADPLRATPVSSDQRSQHCSSVHGAAGLRQAQRNTMAPALARRGFGCEQRKCSRGSIRMPPRAVTAAATRASPFDRATGSSASRMNSAIAPNVPKLQFVS
jgi:hypothetical protein